MQNPNGLRAPRNKGQAVAQPELPLRKMAPMCERLRGEGKWAVCGAGGVPEKPLNMREAEDVMLEKGRADPSTAAVVNRADSACQNAVNKTGDHGGAGDAKVRIYMDVLWGTMARAYAAACGNPYVDRDSTISDETFMAAAGDYGRLSAITPTMFMSAHEEARKSQMPLLSAYTYYARKLVRGMNGFSGVELVPMDMARYSRALKDEALVTACHLGIPRIVPLANESRGFIARAVAAIERDDVWFLPNLPAAFRPEPGDLGHFPASALERHKSEVLPADVTAIEVKFRHAGERERRAPMDYFHATKKGIAEILSNRFGLRYINTYMGKETADKLLSLVGFAMMDVNAPGSAVMRTDSNFIYTIEGARAAALKKANDSISAWMDKSGVSAFEPSLVGVDAGGLHTNDLRAALELAGMGAGRYQTEVLTYADLLIAAVNIFKPEIVDEAIRRIGADDAKARELAGKAVGVAKAACSMEGVRDAADAVWTLRSGNGPDAEKNEAIIWAFAAGLGKEFRNALIDIMSAL